jgi:hypothetical protein
MRKRQICPLCRGIYEDICIDQHVDDDAGFGHVNDEFGYFDYEYGSSDGDHYPEFMDLRRMALAALEDRI